jgi:predicted acetyltransferase
MIPYTLNMRGKQVRVDTLTGVSTDPSFRNHGYARLLMATALEDMATRGLGFNFLYPFSHAFYEKLGWATCSSALEYRVQLTDLPEIMPDGFSADAEPQPDCNKLSSIYENFMANYNCRAVRDADAWRKLLGDNAASGGFVLVIRRLGEPCAYAFCEEEREELLITEMAYTQLNALPAVLAALKARGLPVRWTAPEDSRAHLLPGRWMNAVKLQPHDMFRITDVPLAFSQAAPACEGQFALEVTGDDMRPENNGVYIVRTERGEAKAAKADGKSQFTCEIATLARILTGYMDAAEAVDAGLAQGENVVVELLTKMYPKQRNFLFELY